MFISLNVHIIFFILSAGPFNVTIKGNGFDKTHDLSKVTCNFRLNDTDNQGWYCFILWYVLSALGQVKGIHELDKKEIEHYRGPMPT